MRGLWPTLGVERFSTRKTDHDPGERTLNDGPTSDGKRHSTPDPGAALPRNWFDAQRLEEIEQTLQRAKPGTLAEVTLIKAGFISEQEIASVYGEDLFLPVVNSSVEVGPVEKELGGVLPEKLCVDRLFCPLALRDTVLDVAFVSPEEMGVVDELQLMTGLSNQSADRAVIGG